MTTPSTAFILKHPGGCSGMFWRKDPRNPTSNKPTVDWPRNGTILRGQVHEMKEQLFENSETWLEVFEYKPTSSKDFIPVTPTPGWIPFYQDGLLLFPTSIL
jgi:hypothetical protein